MPWPEDALTDDEDIVVAFRQHWKLLAVPFVWFVGVLIVLVVIFQWLPVGGAFELILDLLALAAFAWFVVRPVVDWWMTRYVLTTERLITRKGLIAQSGVEIPLERITNVNFSQSFWERFLGAGDLLVESAGTTGQSRFANIPRPDQFASVLYNARERRTLALQSGSAAGDAKDDDAIDKLSRLKRLHDDGIISDTEYEEKRKKLLEEI
ncbi:MAG: PH domain-containing protein [Actinobacteria bacterium]|nr:PH domain-containing protein [Actinomycetota bacterium]